MGSTDDLFPGKADGGDEAFDALLAAAEAGILETLEEGLDIDAGRARIFAGALLRPRSPVRPGAPAAGTAGGAEEDDWEMVGPAGGQPGGPCDGRSGGQPGVQLPQLWARLWDMRKALIRLRRLCADDALRGRVTPAARRRLDAGWAHVDVLRRQLTTRRATRSEAVEALGRVARAVAELDGQLARPHAVGRPPGAEAAQARELCAELTHAVRLALRVVGGLVDPSDKEMCAPAQ
ncbi:hypothetical protein [Streptomyces sp. MST-110588]|uniref:hypothetical protein n=1 Tax=Streptomyces sp. MST-110588 TaxID=2833628 RepID=UPI001F5D1384|nr:hypothetical protein [Streptomyces sp. MST-110588]UNO38580.1 hypothetical protein KGS77_01615 [Streptomyces sp. MST-110588]